jgi:protein-ribulosamine 3-kinase
MVASEYQAMNELYKVIPEMVAKPVAWGSYESIPDTHFFVTEFHEMSEDVPDVADFPALVAELHKRGVSPDGKFGFPFKTYGGNNPQQFPISDTWEECYTKGMQGIFAAEMATHGADEEMEHLENMMVEKVIPRLLRPLETGGRSIAPRLVHGDLWDGNASVDVATGHPMIFDATPLYAHNEC